MHKNLLSMRMTVQTLHILDPESASFHSCSAKPLFKAVRIALLSQ